jgi:hypothetical protein
MVFSINNSPASLREIKSVMEIAGEDLDLLDGRELWIYENYYKPEGRFELPTYCLPSNCTTTMLHWHLK